MMKTTNIWRNFAWLWAGLFTVLFISCDSMEDDAKPAVPKVTISDEEVFIVTNHAGYIDLSSKIKTNGKVKLNIASRPTKGLLSEVAGGFLRYKPEATFKTGRDVFTISVFSETNQLITTDSVVIVVADSTQVPCGVYPKDDWIYSSGTPIEVPVLNNDFVCGDSTDVLLEIYKPGPSFPPFLGNAVVTSDNQIRYTASVGEEVPVIEDTVVYKVSRKSNPGVFGYGTLYINALTRCWPSLGGATITATSQKVGTDSLFLWVMPGAPICGKNYTENLSVTTHPKNGTAVVQANWIWYIFDHASANAQVTDSLVYQLCAGQECLEAKMKIQIN